MTARSIRMKLFLLATMLACALAARDAFAQACMNDIDCTAHPECGGEVCDWVTAPIQTCKPAGGQPTGMDGWCSMDSDCKCHSLGATCKNLMCTFTKPCEADGGTCSGGTGTAGTSGGTGTAGTSGGGGGGGGCSVGGQDAGGWSALLAAFGLIALRARRRR